MTVEKHREFEDKLNEGEEPPEEEFVGADDIEDEIFDAQDSAYQDGAEGEEEEDIEIDLSNNSWAYFDQHQDSVFVIAKHPKLPMVVTGGGDNIAHLWTTHSQPPKFVGSIEGHKESVVATGFTGDGKFLITGDMNGFLQVHKAKSGGEKWIKFGDLDQVEEILFITVHPKLPYFAFGANDGSVWVYHIDDLSSSLEQILSGFLHTLECNAGLFVNVVDENKLELVTVSEDGSVVIWNCFANEVKAKLTAQDEFKGIESAWVSISAHKNLVAVGGRDGHLAVINYDTGKVVHSVKTIEDAEDEFDLSIEALTWANATLMNFLAVGLVSGDVLFFDSLQWRLRKSFKIEDAVTKLQFIDDSPFLVGSCMNGKVYKWDARTGNEMFVGTGHNMGVLDFTVMEGGKKIVTAGDEGVSLVFVEQ